MQVGRGPGDTVLDGSPAPHVRCGKTAGWIKMSLGMEAGLVPDDIVLDGDRSPNFWPMSIVAKRSPIAATSELLLWPSYVIGGHYIFAL